MRATIVRGLPHDILESSKVSIALNGFTQASLSLRQGAIWQHRPDPGPRRRVPEHEPLHLGIRSAAPMAPGEEGAFRM